ncbi:Glutamate 5-kinase [Sorochytrium milnesiophthora]
MASTTMTDTSTLADGAGTSTPRRTKSLTIVIKVGTSSICDEKTHFPRLSILAKLVETIVQCHKVVLVTSGAIGVGLKAMDMPTRPKKLAKLQALAGIGQCRLMSLYDALFAQYAVPVAQVLLSRGDIADRSHYLNACNTFRELLSFSTAAAPTPGNTTSDKPVLPIVNENDAVSVSEIKFGDNDTLSAVVAGMVQAHWLFLLTDVDCLYTDNPRLHPDTARPVTVVRSIEELRNKVSVTSSGSSLGTGGMATKLIAAELATAAGANVVVSSATRAERILELIQQQHSNVKGDADIELAADSTVKVYGTTFMACERPMDDRKWILHGLKPRGAVTVDRGAYIALTHKASLFSPGIVSVSGSFSASQAVEIYVIDRHLPPGADSSEPKLVGRGIVNYSAIELRQMAGKKSEEIAQILGYQDADCVMHRSSVVITKHDAQSVAS